MPNRLAHERSPYLRQHADNPVDWMPWGPEAFSRARSEAKPIFLSIGYSTCHWCHVMARECFENPQIAALMNEHFVCIKVDREERPDVDRVYMAYLQAITGQGGWPLNAWLTPDLKPFYAGTYFPPEDRQGRGGLPTILKAIARGWAEDRDRIIAEGNRAIEALAEHTKPGMVADSGDPLSESAGNAYETAFQYYTEAYDGQRGGFGGAPKFPRPANLSFLLQCAALQGAETPVGQEALSMVSHTLAQMSRGGIHDHVGGGFHRYSVDADWFVPHFEKMLYDQAQIAVCSLETWKATGDERYAWLARDILDYVLRDLTSPEGGFYSAEDADSDREGGGHAEGAFYVWTWEEFKAVLGEDAAFLADHFGVRPAGNVSPEADPYGEFTGRNILSQKQSLTVSASRAKLDLQEANDRLARGLSLLYQARSGRPRPHRDEKVLTAWNGLMISAFALASACPAESLADRRDRYREAAVRAASFLKSALVQPKTGLLLRSWSGGAATIEGFSEDYAFLIQGLLDLHEATADARWLRWADELQQVFDALFYDAGKGGYFNSPAGAEDIVLRLKEDYDGAEPAASSVAALNLLRFSSILHDEGARERGRQTIEAFKSRWLGTPHALPQLLCALEAALEPPRHVVLAGNPSHPGFKALADTVASCFGARRSILARTPLSEQPWLEARAPWITLFDPSPSEPTAYVCEAYTCKAPCTDPAVLRDQLSAKS